MDDPKKTLDKIEELIVLARVQRRVPKLPAIRGADGLHLGWVREWLQDRYQTLAGELQRECEAEIKAGRTTP